MNIFILFIVAVVFTFNSHCQYFFNEYVFDEETYQNPSFYPFENGAEFEKSMKPNKNESFQNVKAPSIDSIFNIGHSELEEEIGHETLALEMPNGLKLRRFQHTVDSLPVWNGGGVVEETTIGFKGLQLRAKSTNCFNRPNNHLASRYARSISFKNFNMVSWSKRQCLEQLAGFLIGLANSTVKAERFLYQGDDPTLEPVTADLVEIRGVNGSLELADYPYHIQYFCLFNTAEQKIIKHWSGIQTFLKGFPFQGGNDKAGIWTYFHKPGTSFNNYSTKDDFPSKVLRKNWCQVVQSTFHFLFKTVFVLFH